MRLVLGKIAESWGFAQWLTSDIRIDPKRNARFRSRIFASLAGYLRMVIKVTVSLFQRDGVRAW